MKSNRFNIDMGQRIMKLRNSRGDTQRKLQIDIGISSRETVNQWESGSRDISATNLAKLANNYGVSADYLLGLIPYETHEVKAISELTGLSQRSIEILEVEKDSLRIDILNKLLENADFWEMLNIIEESSITRRVIQDRNELLSKEYLKTLSDGSAPDENEAIERARIACEKSKYNYELSKWKCQLIFKSIIDLLLPDIGRGKNGKTGK